MLELRQTLNLKLQQQLVMTPQLQQAIRLLQLSRMELVDAIHAEIEQNPVLEEELGPQVSELEEERALTGQEPKVKDIAQNDVPLSKDGVRDDIDWKAYLEAATSSTPKGTAQRSDAEDLPSLEQTLSRSETLCEYLTGQLNLIKMLEIDRAIALQIIGALDDKGFLAGPRPLEDIAIRMGVSTQHVERVLGRVQTLEPVGIAARCLEECLLIQLREKGNDNVLAERLIEHHLSSLQKRNYQAIAKKEEVELFDVAAALKIIQRLDPRPARNFGDPAPIYITPDLYVVIVGNKYVIIQNNDGLPKLKLSKYYRTALADGASQEAKGYIREKLRSAQWLIRSIHQRQQTIYKVMASILKFQRAFFDKGIDHLKPLILRDIAEDIGMHESTVSRVTSNKYVHTPRGIFELKYFFNSTIQRSSGNGVASVSVKHRIKQLIECEDPQRPHSDQAITNLLKKDNIKIARRTVAKYREGLGILSSAQRKRIV